MKKNFVKILAIMLIMCLTVPFVACVVDMPADEDSYAYVAIDINPSLELIVKDEVVVKVRAINDDANVLLSGETIEGLSLEDATEKIVSLAEELGYLNEDNTDVNITVTTDDEVAIEKIEEKAEKAIKKGSEIAKVVRNARQEDIAKVEELKEQNPKLYDKLTPAMNRIIEEILALNPELTYEALMEMKVSELVEMLEGLAKEKDEAVSEEVKEEMENRHKELKKEAKRKMAELYGEDYLEKFDKNNALEGVFDKIKERIEFTEEDVNTILALLGVESVEELVADGKLTVEAIEGYIQENLVSTLDEEALKALKAELEAIYEEYKKDDKELTEEDLEEIKEVVGEHIDLEKLDDLKSFIDEHKEKIEEEKEKIELTEEQKAELDKIKEEMKDSYDKVKEEFKDKIEESKNEFDKIKEQKREEFKSKQEKPDGENAEIDENTEENTEEGAEENTEEGSEVEESKKPSLLERIFGKQNR